MARAPRVFLQPFNYDGVRLLDGPFARQLADTRDYYLNIPDANILKGFRQQAGLPAPGQDLGGWCLHDAGVVFGQWLSGMARLSKATGDADLRDKAVHLMTEWGKTLSSLVYSHYVYDKYVCGLLDMFEYAGQSAALPLLAQCTAWASDNLSRRRLPASDDDSQGGYFTGDSEWYTLAEHLYRAYQLTGEARYREFAEVWLYPHYWEMFTGKKPPAPHGFHGYSHVNALSSAAMAYAVSGDPEYLTCIVSAYDYFQNTQCYATGGYGPGEKLMRPDGSLGESIVVEPNDRFLRYHIGRSFEAPCGTWAVFKLGRYLLQFTGEARYGDWMEQVLYNGIGASLPMAPKGRTFYYSDYRLSGGSKLYHQDAWPCCSGTYLQAVADYANIIYFRDAAGLCVNLYLPSDVRWEQDGQTITLTQQTGYPESGTVSLALHMERSAAFNLRWRIPGWCKGASARLNGEAVAVAGAPGTWAGIERVWQPGDQVVIRLPIEPRLVPIDSQHPQRVAVVCGPAVLVRVDEGLRVGPALSDWISPTDRPLHFVTHNEEPAGRFMPFYQVGLGVPYRMYFDIGGR